MSERVWSCRVCKATVDMAIFIPELQVRLGRPLTDDELAQAPGPWHACPGPPQRDRENGPQLAKTRYDWRTHGK